MSNLSEKSLEIIASEAFMRRAALLDPSFMLKGSFVSRQYYDDPNIRIPNDLDWVYLEHIEDQSKANKIFDNWILAITDMVYFDSVQFVSFNENRFWRGIDYAMSDDFPTVNTDLVAIIDGQEVDLSIDISFNLDFKQDPVALNYKGLKGNDFNLPSTVPLSLQISWKIHQTIIRPRFKDLEDLIYLTQHPDFTPAVFEVTIEELFAECQKDSIPKKQVYRFFKGDIKGLFSKANSTNLNGTITFNWRLWKQHRNYTYTDTIFSENLDDFLLHFNRAMFISNLTLDFLNENEIKYRRSSFMKNFMR